MSLELIPAESGFAVHLTGVTDDLGAAVSSATIAATLYDSSGHAVGSPVTLAAVIGTAGMYRGLFPDASLTVGATYTIKAVSTSPKRTWSLSAIVQAAN